jgi:hypothetical protein
MRLMNRYKLTLALMNPISEVLPIKISNVAELIACIHDMIFTDNEIRW